MFLKEIYDIITRRARQASARSLLLPAILALVTACSSIDCPLNSLVYTNYALYDSNGETYTLGDTLTIMTTYADGNDVIVLNKAVDIASFALPISYGHDSDEFCFELLDNENDTIYDTVRVEKDNIPHFESTDCGPSFFHNIKGVICTNNAIDSVVINTTLVDYDTTKEHFRIYFKHRD